MLRGDEYNEVLLKYINLEAELEMATNHKLSKEIIDNLTAEKKVAREKLNHLVIIKQLKKDL